MADRLRRSFDFAVTRSETDDDGLTLEGYASVFNTPTSIRDWEGEYVETVAPGAFTKTLSERTPILQFDHGTHPMIGSIPLGVVQTAREDDHGLFIRSRLSDNWLVQPVRDAIADGAITGMSFQFEVLKQEWSQDRSERTIREVKLYEVGPVVWPAYEQTSVGVRSEISNLLSCENLRVDLARALTFADPEAASTGTSGDANVEPPVPALVVPDQKAAEKAGRVAALVAAPSDYLKEVK